MNQKINIIAYPVQDITIARYLAAKEIPFIGLELQVENPSTVVFANQCREWLEGPVIIGFGQDESFLKSCLEEKIIDAYVIHNRLHYENEIISFSEECEPNHIIPLKVYAPNKAIPFAILLNPGHESQTGIFDFDALDSLLEEFGYL